MPDENTPKQKRISLLARSTKYDLPKFRFQKRTSQKPLKRVSFAASEDVRVFECEGDQEQQLGSEWISSLIERQEASRQKDEAGSSSTQSDDLSGSTISNDQSVSTPDVSSEDGGRKFKSINRFIVSRKEEADTEDKGGWLISDGKDWNKHHSQDFDQEWSEISIAAQRKVHGSTKKKSFRLSLPKRQSGGGVGIPPSGMAASAGTITTTAAITVNTPAGQTEISTTKSRKMTKKKRRKKKKQGKKSKKDAKKKKKKKSKKMSVMAFLRGSIKRNSKAKVEKALKKMMRRIVKRVKARRERMMEDEDVDLVKLKKHIRRGRKRKKLYTLKKIRGRPLGLKSLLKTWKWAFIFS